MGDIENLDDIRQERKDPEKDNEGRKRGQFVGQASVGKVSASNIQGRVSRGQIVSNTPETETDKNKKAVISKEGCQEGRVSGMHPF